MPHCHCLQPKTAHLMEFEVVEVTELECLSLFKVDLYYWLFLQETNCKIFVLLLANYLDFRYLEKVVLLTRSVFVFQYQLYFEYVLQ